MGVGTRVEEISDKQSRSSWSMQGKEYKAPPSPSSLTGSAPPKLSCRFKNCFTNVSARVKDDFPTRDVAEKGVLAVWLVIPTEIPSAV